MCATTRSKGSPSRRAWDICPGQRSLPVKLMMYNLASMVVLGVSDGGGTVQAEAFQ